jgi:hypothetical protein
LDPNTEGAIEGPWSALYDKSSATPEKCQIKRIIRHPYSTAYKNIFLHLIFVFPNHRSKITFVIALLE